jgi:hypothetical protein
MSRRLLAIGLLVGCALIQRTTLSQIDLYIPNDVKMQAENAAKESLKATSEKEAADLKKRQLLLTILNEFNSNETKFSYFEFLPSQIEKIKALQSEFKSAAATLKEENMFDAKLPRSERFKAQQQFKNQFFDLRKEFVSKLDAILLDHQFEFAMALDVGESGIPKSLVESELGNVLELTEQQKLRIKQNSEAVVRKLMDFSQEIRKEAFSTFASELTPEQLEKLKEIYGAERLKKHLETREFHEMFEDNLFDAANIEELDSLKVPLHAILRTDLDLR